MLNHPKSIFYVVGLYFETYDSLVHFERRARAHEQGKIAYISCQYSCKHTELTKLLKFTHFSRFTYQYM